MKKALRVQKKSKKSLKLKKLYKIRDNIRNLKRKFIGEKM